MHSLNEKKNEIFLFCPKIKVIIVDTSFPWEECNEVLYFIRDVKHEINTSAETLTGGQGGWALLK